MRALSGRESLARPSEFGIRAHQGGHLHEDDVVHHLGSLPNFEGRLAEEDSERLMTYLTVCPTDSNPQPVHATPLTDQRDRIS